MPPKSDDTTERVQVDTHRTVRVVTADDPTKIAYELTNINGEVAVRKVSTSRNKVTMRFEDLQEAVGKLVP